MQNRFASWRSTSSFRLTFIRPCRMVEMCSPWNCAKMPKALVETSARIATGEPIALRKGHEARGNRWCREGHGSLDPSWQQSATNGWEP